MNDSKTHYTSDPYRLFFPLGILFGLWGTGLWILFYFLKNISYPGLLHPSIMISGFLMIVATGFLMTAIPRFTNTSHASSAEKNLALLPILAQALFLIMGLLPGFQLASVVSVLFLFRFGITRIQRSAHFPIPSFVLVGLGLFGFAVGNLLMASASVWNIAPHWQKLARLLAFQGLFLGLGLGIGSQLIPSIMGTLKQKPGEPCQPTPLSFETLKRRKIFFFLGYGLILWGSFFLEAFIHQQIALFLRAFLITSLLFGKWRIHTRPSVPGILSWCLWTCSWMLALGYWPGALYPAYSLHGNHIIFIGSLSLMIFAIASRVTLAHGGYSREAEKKSIFVTLLLFLMLLAMATRVSAPWVPNPFSHYAYASLLWIVSVLIWGSFFIPKMILIKK